MSLIHSSMDTHNKELIPALYVVSVPIGCLEDITLRALRVLQSVDIIYCEDTRVTRKLLMLYNIDVPELYRADDHTEENAGHFIADHIRLGKKIALVSDAGTPLISDPGFRIVSYLRSHNLPVIPVAGVCAMIAALSCSGLPSDRFIFAGFPPKKMVARQKYLQELLTMRGTYLFYERADRLEGICSDLQAFFPDVKIVIARELTKLYEEFISGTPHDIIDILKSRSLKGEVVLCVFYEKTEVFSDIDLENDIMTSLKEGKAVKDIVINMMQKTGQSRKILYALIQNYKNNLSS